MKLNFFVILVTLLITVSSCNSAEMSSASAKKSKDNKVEPKSPVTGAEDEGQGETEGDVDIDKPDQDGVLTVSPETVRLFIGESQQLKADIKIEKKSSDVTKKAEWTADSNNITVDDGLVVAKSAGQASAKANFEGQDATANITVIKCKDVNAGSNASKIRVKGENWPGNSVDAGGADFDDYFVVLTGSFAIEGFQIFSKVDQEFIVDFSIGSSGKTSQKVKLQAVDCDGIPTESQDVSTSTGTGQKKIKAAKGDRFNLITTALTGSTTRVYDLLKDKNSAFRVVTEQN